MFRRARQTTESGARNDTILLTLNRIELGPENVKRDWIAIVVAIGAFVLLPVECGLIAWRFGAFGYPMTDGVAVWESTVGGPPTWCVVSVGALAISCAVCGLAGPLVVYKRQRLIIVVGIVLVTCAVFYAIWIERYLRIPVS